MTAVAAQYQGRCPGGDAIEVGDLIVQVNDMWVHLDCEGEALTQLDKDATKRVCTVCFLVEGSCDCDNGGTYYE